jgi:predicted Zn finger-like uncharacterized protein
MPITVACSSCNTKLRVRDELAGRKVKCPKCDSVIEVSSDQPPMAEGVVARKPFPKRPTPELDETDDEEPRRKRPSIDDTDEEDDDNLDDQPRKKKKGGGKKFSRAELQSIATYQKVVLLCILANVLAGGARAFMPPQLQLPVAIGSLGVLISVAVFVFLMSRRFYSLWVRIALGIVSLIPCIGLVSLLIVNGKATSVLKANGIRVGLLGARMSDLK